MPPQRGQIEAALQRLQDGDFIRLPLKGNTKTFKMIKVKVDPRVIEEEEVRMGTVSMIIEHSFLRVGKDR